MNILELAKRNQQKAWEIIEDTRIVRIIDETSGY